MGCVGICGRTGWPGASRAFFVGLSDEVAQRSCSAGVPPAIRWTAIKKSPSIRKGSRRLLETSYERILWRTKPASPSSPLPSRVIVAGSGMAAVLPTIIASELGVMNLIFPSTTSMA